ncbi:MAG: hypothetical protein QGG62_05500 [Candidatus Poseidoniaceae archaeon]|jgi:hypothetical protein|nr:hypothetical protein [Euryarchaeota archaeon]MDP6866373.1 hypothetical protein [Candidatus Poseidoniaceae archaeon]|tara:strand:+ start:2609 stop:3151 length:543 start_codon:yes stop_codon:yes gene_type:complete
MIPVMDLEAIDITYNQWMRACIQAEAQAVESEDVLTVQRNAAIHGRWDLVYNLSLIAGLETSVLIDANGEIQIDWGSPGRVPLRPPVGMMAPFQVWVHTHPGFQAYWSGTDKNSLAIAQGILSSALVLGAPGIKQSRNIGPENIQSIAQEGPLQYWTEEEVVPWDRWYTQLQATPVEVIA